MVLFNQKILEISRIFLYNKKISRDKEVLELRLEIIDTIVKVANLIFYLLKKRKGLMLMLISITILLLGTPVINLQEAQGLLHLY